MRHRQPAHRPRHRIVGPSLLPGRLLDLKNWKLTLPTGHKGKPEEIEGPDLSSFTNEFFRLNEAENGVAFTANAAASPRPAAPTPDRSCAR